MEIKYFHDLLLYHHRMQRGLKTLKSIGIFLMKHTISIEITLILTDLEQKRQLNKHHNKKV